MEGSSINDGMLTINKKVIYYTKQHYLLTLNSQIVTV